MLIKASQLTALGVPEPAAARFAEPLSAACALHDITTPQRLAAFVPQVLHESGMLQRLEEDLHYRTASRVAHLFRTAFDTDRSGSLSQYEIQIAEGFVMQPERLANRAYAGRNGNGNEASGDGWRFRGRGPIQLTGRAWYQRAANELGRPYVDQPDLLLQPSDGALVAAWYWALNRCNALADAFRFADITRAINGPAMVGAADRLAMFGRARRIWPC
jgi:putative chitinase